MTDDEDITIKLTNEKSYEVLEANILKGSDPRDKNTFEEPDKVAVRKFTDYKAEGNKIIFRLPASSVLELRVK